MRKYNWIKNFLPYLLVVLAITLPWFFSSGYLFFTDFVFGPNINLDWRDAFFSIKILMKFLSYLLPHEMVEKIFISAALLIVILGGKKIAENFLENKWLVFIASLFALFNPFIYDRVMYGQISMVLAFGLACLCFGFLLEYLKTNENKQIILAGIFAGLSILFANTFMFFLGVVYFLFLILILMRNKQDFWKYFFKIISYSIVIVILINFNWLYVFFVGDSSVSKTINSGIQKQDLVVFQTAGKDGKEALTNVLMMSGFWGKEQFRYIDLTKFKENWGRSFYLLLPLILWGVFIAFKNGKSKFQISNVKSNPKSKAQISNQTQNQNYNAKFKNLNLRHFAIGLIIVYIIAVVLAVGIRLPIAREITYWLFDNIPFYKGLRETQKWAALIVLVYAVFLAIGVRELFSKKIIQNNAFISKLFLSGIIIMQTPLLLWGLGGQVKPIQYPNDWREINEFIKLESYKVESKKCDDKILFLPWHMYMSFKWIGAIVANPANRFFDCPVISGTNMEFGGIYDNSQSKEGRAVQLWLASRGRTDFLTANSFGVKYIILAKEIDWQNYLWLNFNPQVKLIKETEMIILYEVL